MRTGQTFETPPKPTLSMEPSILARKDRKKAEQEDGGDFGTELFQMVSSMPIPSSGSPLGKGAQTHQPIEVDFAGDEPSVDSNFGRIVETRREAAEKNRGALALNRNHQKILDQTKKDPETIPSAEFSGALSKPPVGSFPELDPLLEKKEAALGHSIKNPLKVKSKQVGNDRSGVSPLHSERSRAESQGSKSPLGFLSSQLLGQKVDQLADSRFREPIDAAFATRQPSPGVLSDELIQTGESQPENLSDWSLPESVDQSSNRSTHNMIQNSAYNPGDESNKTSPRQLSGSDFLSALQTVKAPKHASNPSVLATNGRQDSQESGKAQKPLRPRGQASHSSDAVFSKNPFELSQSLEKSSKRGEGPKTGAEFQKELSEKPISSHPFVKRLESKGKPIEGSEPPKADLAQIGGSILSKPLGPLQTDLTAVVQKGHLAASAVGRELEFERLTSDSTHRLGQTIQAIHVQGGKQGGAGEVRLWLKPESLGGMSIRIMTSKEGKVGLQIHAGDERTKKIFEESLTQLKESLAQHHLDLGQVNIAVAGGKQEETFNHFGNLENGRAGWTGANSNSDQTPFSDQPGRSFQQDQYQTQEERQRGRQQGFEFEIPQPGPVRRATSSRVVNPNQTYLRQPPKETLNIQA